MVITRVQTKVVMGRFFGTKQSEDDVVRTGLAGIAAVLAQSATHPVS